MEQKYGNKAQVAVHKFKGIDYFLAADAARWIGLPENWILDAVREGGLETHVSMPRVAVSTFVHPETGEKYIPKSTAEIIAYRFNLNVAYLKRNARQPEDTRGMETTSL